MKEYFIPCFCLERNGEKDRVDLAGNFLISESISINQQENGKENDHEKIKVMGSRNPFGGCIGAVQFLSHSRRV